MAEKEQDARKRIIDAATEILYEVSDIEKITVRQIAERANVGIGTINYHFNSKDNLLSFAVGEVMTDRINGFLRSQKKSELEPVENLKTMLKEVCQIAIENKKLIQFMLTQIISNGDMKTPLYIIPFLKAIFGSQKEEVELRIIALQIIQPIQLIGISPDAFLMYSSVDFFDERDRNKFIDILVDNVIRK